MPSQILTTIIISTLIIILALQLSEEKSVIIEYCNVGVLFIHYNKLFSPPPFLSNRIFIHVDIEFVELIKALQVTVF